MIERPHEELSTVSCDCGLQATVEIIPDQAEVDYVLSKVHVDSTATTRAALPTIDSA